MGVDDRPRTCIVLGALALLLAAGAERSRAAAPAVTAPPRVASVPITLDHNRMLIELEFVRPDGSPRRARAWVDSGSEFLRLAEPLARELGLDLAALASAPGGHSVELAVAPPPVRLAGLPLDVAGVAVRVQPGPRVQPGVPAEAVLPASALRHDHVVFDYPAGRLTVARPEALPPRGVAIPCRVNPDTGLFMIEATMDGELVPLGIDLGSAGTWVSTTLTGAWRTRHPDWPSAIGAVGSTNFFGVPFEIDGVLVRLPELRIGSLSAREVAVLGLTPGLFDWYSKKSAAPVVGFLGGNVLRRFRVEIDYPSRTTYWEAGAASGAEDLDIVGLTLRVEPDGRITVAGVPTRAGRRTVEGVEPGATLLSVGDLEVARTTFGAVVEALRGRPGETRRLELEQNGRNVTINAPVTRFP